MKAALILMLIVFSTIAACTEPAQDPIIKSPELSKKTFEVKVADTQIQENKRIADLTIDQFGDIQLIPMTQDPSIDGLRSLIDEIKSRPGLFLEYDTREGDKIVMRRDLITPSDPRYIYPFTDELGVNGYLLKERKTSTPITVTITQGTQYNGGGLHIGVVSVNSSAATLSLRTDSEQKTVNLPVGEQLTIGSYSIKNMKSEAWAGGWMPGQSSGKVDLEISQSP